MILHANGSFYIEHGSRRKGYFNSRFKASDAGRRDMNRSLVYKAERVADKCEYAFIPLPKSSLRRYVTASMIDIIVTQDEYLKWFGSTSLLVNFSGRLKSSRACVGCIEFADRDSVSLFDIYHELAHHVSMRHNEPHHGDRFIAAFILIASLSPFTDHSSYLDSPLDMEGLYPTDKYFKSQYMYDCLV